LRTGEALITNSEFTTAQIVRIRPAQAKKIDPFLIKQEDNIEDADADNNADISDEE
jgi:hypothetical protein